MNYKGCDCECCRRWRAREEENDYIYIPPLRDESKLGIGRIVRSIKEWLRND